MKGLFSRDQLIGGLNSLIGSLQREGAQGVRVRIIGGAALQLAYFEREATVDVDAQLTPKADVLVAAYEVASIKGWVRTWLNDEAAKFMPSNLGPRTTEWDVLYRDAQIEISVASAQTLLAMKLRSLEARGRRDREDVRKLFAITRMTTPNEALELYEDFYPGDSLTIGTIGQLEQILDSPGPEPRMPERPHLGPVNS